MSVSTVAPSEIVLQNTTGRIAIIVHDENGNLDPYNINLRVLDRSGSVLMQDIWPNPANRIIHSGLGQFYVDYGPTTAKFDGAHLAGVTTLNVEEANPANSVFWPATGNVTLDFGYNKETIQYTSINITSSSGTITLATPTTIQHAGGMIVTGSTSETESLGEVLFDWQVQVTQGGPISDSIQKVKVVSSRMASLLPEFKLMIDKTRKFVDVASECYLGYTNDQLVAFLEGGLGTINAYQPSVMFSMENYPLEHRQILLDAGLLVGVMSQQLYAIDTDIPNYNDQGTSFVIAHQPQLASFFNQVSQRLDKMIPMMKLFYINSGGVHVQMGPSYRLQQIMEAAPGGSLFRNLIFKP